MVKNETHIDFGKVFTYTCKKGKSGLLFVPYINRFPFTHTQTNKHIYQALPCMKTLPTYSFLFFALSFLLFACVPEQQAMDLTQSYPTHAMFVSNKPTEGLSAFFDQKSRRIIGFISAKYPPVKIRVYNGDDDFVFGENLSEVGKQHDFNINFTKKAPGIYRVRIILENEDVLEQWLIVDH
jgi:hypothetical protein